MRIALFGSAIALTAFNCLAAPVGESNSKKKDRYAESIPEPTLSNVAYGDKKRNVMDFWKAPSDKPTPVVIAIHGGGWNGGSKEMLDKFVDTEALLEAGISVAAINYRLIKHSKDLEPPVKGPMSDAARAVQFLRSKARNGISIRTASPRQAARLAHAPRFGSPIMTISQCRTAAIPSDANRHALPAWQFLGCNPLSIRSRSRNGFQTARMVPTLSEKRVLISFSRTGSRSSPQSKSILPMPI